MHIKQHKIRKMSNTNHFFNYDYSDKVRGKTSTVQAEHHWQTGNSRGSDPNLHYI